MVTDEDGMVDEACVVAKMGMLGWEYVDEFEMERVTFERIEVNKNERGKQAFALNESYSGCMGPSFAL
jgi:hypothetical protein